MGEQGDRKCAWCGADISHRCRNAKYCTVRCRDEANHRAKMSRADCRDSRMFGPHPARNCQECGKPFEAVKKVQKYCEPQGYCARKSVRQNETTKAYLSRPDVREKKKQHQKKYRQSDRYRDKLKKRTQDPEWRAKRREYQREYRSRDYVKEKQREVDARPEAVARRKAYDDSERGRASHRASHRRRAAAAALSLLILPVEKPE